ncbi:MAG: T9SS type A sorting domain-containing protein [Candidatus Methanofastidiosa archaeon]|nr:T9SS type A sorting domain-containing protein [Candidatus Methanofastidiosa archaeon]
MNWIQLKDSSRTKFSRYFTSYAVVTPYSIVATASNGDIYRYSLDYTSIDEGFSARNSDRIEIFPNPVSTPPNTFTAKIRLRKSAIIKLKIYNTLGRLIEERCSESSSDEYEWLLSTEQYPNGVYFLRIESDSGEYLSKVFLVLR